MRLFRFKSFLLITLISFGFISSSKKAPATFKVIKVSGEILYKRTSKNMMQGDQFSENEELVFKTSESRAAVISVQKGRFILAPGFDKNKLSGKANLLPPASNISSRDGALLNVVDLQAYFSGKLVILEKEKIQVGKDNFPLTDENFFFLQFNYREETINKKLKAEQDQIVFDRKEILSIDGKAFESDFLECTLNYMNKNNQIQEISQFTLYLPSSDNLKTEIEILFSESGKDKDNKQKTEEVLSYLKDFYGKSRKGNVSSWIATYFPGN